MIFNCNIIDKNDLKLCFFNANYYCDYLKNYNYFFNIKNTFFFELDNYIKSKNNSFKWPEISSNKNCNSFVEYIHKKLSDKILNIFGKKYNKIKLTKINNNTQNDIINLFNILTELEYINMNDIFNKRDEILNLVTYGQENIGNLKTLKDSNIEDFKANFEEQIMYILNNKQAQLKTNIDELLSLIDDYFKSDLLISNKKTDSKEIEQFQIKIKDIKSNIVESFNINLYILTNKISDIKNQIIQILLNKKDELNSNGNYRDILGNINLSIENIIKKMNSEIDDILSNIDSSIISFYEECQKQLSNFSGRKFNWKIMKNFKDFLLTKMGVDNQNLNIQICNEIITSINLSNIYNSKGFKELMKSIFSENHLIHNKIDILKDKLFQELEKLVNNLNEHSRSYMQLILDSINILLEISTIEFSDDQSIIWEEIEKYYNIIKNKIKKSIVLE